MFGQQHSIRQCVQNATLCGTDYNQELIMAIRRKILMQKPILILDLDGVLANFYKGLAKAYGVPYAWPKPRMASDGIPIEDAFNLPGPWHEVCDQSFWENLDKMPDADKIIEIVLQFFEKDRICIATSFPVDLGISTGKLDDCFHGKMVWLNKHYPWLCKNFLVGPAKHFCAAPWKWLVDDKDENVDMFRVEGGNAILLPRYWNTQHNLSEVSTGFLLGKLKQEIGL